MNRECVLVFPHQLFEHHPAIAKGRKVFLLEDSLFFGDAQYPCHFHIQKIAYHRFSIQKYTETLLQKGFEAKIIPYDSSWSLFSELQKLKKSGFTSFHWADPDDFILEKRLHQTTQKLSLHTLIYPSPLFLTPLEEAHDFFDHEKKYFMASFYAFQRKRLHILLDGQNKPIGGKWSFDAENRKKLPREIAVPLPRQFSWSTEEIKKMGVLSESFPHSVGKTSSIRPPLTRDEALKALADFLQHRFLNFGEYEDAISSQHPYVFHSYLTPALNIGLITPDEIVKITLEFANSNKIPLNSLEGFIRQIIGWREFIRILYRREGVTMRNRNFFKHHRPLPKAFYTGKTGIPIIDRLIHQLHDKAYCHHIERLMVLGNFMLLCGIEPHDIYRWFMEFFIDSYDWVMVPNVYGMSQFADGGIFATKPYISSSNYIMKMSDEKKDPWQAVWDGLFWRFIHLHRDYFESNIRLSMMVRQLDRMDGGKIKAHLKTAEEYLNKLV